MNDVGEYVIVDQNVIKAHFCGPIPKGDGIVRVPEGFGGLIGQDIREFDSSFRLLPLSERVAAGLVSIGPGFSLDGEQIIEDPLVIVPPTKTELLNAQIEQQVSSLYRSDWYVLRSFETGEPIPDEIKSMRASARQTISDLRIQLTAAGADSAKKTIKGTGK